jgi:hypothetical protein
MQVLHCSAEFEKYGMKALGWYHSHPRIKPMPSTKDLSTQLQVQGMIPYAIGIIAGIYSTNTNFATSCKKNVSASDSSIASVSNSYFSFFRAREDHDGKSGIAVNVTIHRFVFSPALNADFSLFYLLEHLFGPHGSCLACVARSGEFDCRHKSRNVLTFRPPPSTLPNSVVLAENQECHLRRLDACRTDEERVLESSSYARVLSLFRISSMFPLKRFLEEQSRQLKWSVSASVGLSAIKAGLVTGPIAVSPSIINSRWGGGCPVHYLHTTAKLSSSPGDDCDFDVDDRSRIKQHSSSVKRNTLIFSDDSSEEPAAAVRLPPSSTSSATVDSGALVVSAAPAVEESGAQSEIAAIQYSSPSGTRQQQLQCPSWRKIAVAHEDIVFLDD